LRFEKDYYEDDSDDLEGLRECVQLIRDKTTISGRLLQLTEEAAELAAASAKATRIAIGESPSPMNLEECVDKVYEEIADVTACLTVMQIDFDEKINPIACYKLKRWAMRLQRR